MTPQDEKRKEAIAGLVRIAALEAAILVAVIAAWLATGKLSYLIGGLVGAQIIVAPMIVGWIREKAPALRAPEGPPQ